MRKSDICPECRGECQVEYERWVPRSFQDDIGGFESYWSDCENCDGLGEVYADEEIEEELSSSREPKNLMEQERNLIDRYDTWKKANGIPLSKDAMSVLFEGGLTSEQQAWISDFIVEWSWAYLPAKDQSQGQLGLRKVRCNETKRICTSG
jgi:type II secretory ATPase GspE/PulE/Tfp pilus assembly ATPase PilB-like protein